MAYLTPNRDNPLDGKRNSLNKKILFVYTFFFVGLPFLFLELFLFTQFLSSTISIPKFLYSPNFPIPEKIELFFILFIVYFFYSFLAFHLTQDHFPYTNKTAIRILVGSSISLGLIILSGGLINTLHSLFIFSLSHTTVGIGYFSYTFFRKKSPFFGLGMLIFFITGIIILVDALTTSDPIQWPIIAIYMLIQMIISIKSMDSQAQEHEEDLDYRYTQRRKKENTD